MRIRKHAKISPLLYAASSLKPAAILQTHLCQLNQSPWDVITFSPPPSPSPPPPPSFQVNGSDVGAGNGVSGHCASVSERELSSQRRRLSDQDAAAAPPPPPPVEDEATILCCKTDGKSWQCRREAAKGNSLCEHHLSLARNYGGNVAAKKPEKAARPKRIPAASSPSNPYEFYYYSGFGPRWGKRRGEARRNSSNSASSMPKNAQMEPAAISLVGDEDFDFVEYEEDDDEDEEEESRDNGKKRVRKPIKARSLKSLF